MRKKWLIVFLISIAVAVRILMIVAVGFAWTHAVIPREKSGSPTDVYNAVMADIRFSNTQPTLYYIYYSIEKGEPIFRGIWIHTESETLEIAYDIKYVRGDGLASVEESVIFGSLVPISFDEPNLSELKGKIEKEFDRSFKNEEGKCLIIGKYRGYTLEDSFKFWSVELHENFIGIDFDTPIKFSDIEVDHY